MYTECIKMFINKIYLIFWQTFVYKMFVYKMHSTFRQTFAYILLSKFNCHRSFDFVCKMYTKVCQNMGYNLYTFCIHQLYTSCTVFVYKMYTMASLGFIGPPLNLGPPWYQSSRSHLNLSGSIYFRPPYQYLFRTP